MAEGKKSMNSHLSTIQSRRARRAFTMVETMVAVAIFSISLLGFLSGLMFVQRQNRSLTQRDLATSKAVEVLELFKNLPYADIRYSTGASPIYLKRTAVGTGDVVWRVPNEGAWADLPVMSVDSASAATPAVIADKLPDAQWNVTIQTITKGVAPTWTYRAVTVRVRWKYLPGSGDWKEVEMATYITPNFGFL